MNLRLLAVTVCTVVAFGPAVSTSAAADKSAKGDRSAHADALVIGHRGASGYRPEHTLAAYELAIEQCADYIEPDLVSTRNGVLVARHENEISGTTDVASHPEFASRYATKTIDGVVTKGWFTEDFTHAELKTLRAVERIPAIRPQNTAYNGLYEIPTLQEVIDLARSSRSCDGKQVAIYPETKHPSYFDSIGLSMEEELVRVLHANHYRGKNAPVIIQSFEVSNLVELNTMTKLPIAQLVNCSGAPWDFSAAGDPRTYKDLVTPAGLDFVATYADGVGACKDVLIPRDAAGNLLAPSPVIGLAHDRGLIVHGWTVPPRKQVPAAQLPAGHRPECARQPRGRDPRVPRRRHGRLLHRQPRPRCRGRCQLLANSFLPNAIGVT